VWDRFAAPQVKVRFFDVMNNQTLKIINDLKISIDEAVRHREIWWELGYSKNRSKFKNEFRSTRFNHFLHASYEAHAITMYLALGRIFDSDSRSSSICTLKKNLKSSGHIGLVKAIETQLKPYSELVKKVLDVRSKTIAHTDLSHTEYLVFRNNSITPDELKALIHQTRETFYDVLRHFNLTTTQHEDGIFSESTLNVLDQLQT
jgi:hypothetical protein